MRLIKNSGTNRVIDVLRQALQSGASLDIASPALSLFAFFELRDLLNKTAHSRLIIPFNVDGDLNLLGSPADRAARNRLQARWLALECAKWIREKTEVRAPSSSLPQSAYFIRNLNLDQSRVITGNCPLTTDGLGLTPEINIEDTLMPTDGRNITTSQLNSIRNVFSIELPLVPRPDLYSRVNEITENRRSISHGRNKPEDVGRRYTDEEIKKINNDVNEISQHIVNTFSDYCARELYKKNHITCGC